MKDKTPITIAYGDGIGPEIMRATLHILQEAGARITLDEIEIGKHVYERGVPGGIDESAWDVLRRNKVFLKAPITTPQGGGVKSLNVTVRNSLGLYANIRPCRAYSPIVKTRHPEMDVIIVRENEEGLYGGIEHQQTPEVVQCLKLVSLPGCQRIIRYAFEYARIYGRKKVTAFTKDNIMKLTDGLFHRVFDEIAKEYPDIETEHWIVDIGMARMADTPEAFDVIVLPNLYGDILSDIAAQIAGSVGMAGSANIGDHCAMFEAIHGSAPAIADKDMANPSGLIQAAIMMLIHINQPDVATRIHNAWLRTLEEGLHTFDIYDPKESKQQLGTQAFADAIVTYLAKKPKHFKAVHYGESTPTIHIQYDRKQVANVDRQLQGVDVFLYWPHQNVTELAEAIQKITEQKFANEQFDLLIITNRGTKVWPKGFPETFCTDHWRCRFKTKEAKSTMSAIIELLRQLTNVGYEVIKTENIYTFDSKPGYSLGQGE